MKKSIFFCLLFTSFLFHVSAQKKSRDSKVEPYEFETIIENPITSIKSQSYGSISWCYSGMSFIESEILRMTGEEFDLSETFIVSNAYYDRTVKYVRMHGYMNLSPSSSFSDVLAVLDTYGIVPESKMPRKNVTTQELDKVLAAIASVLVKKPSEQLSNMWKNVFQSVLAVYLGEKPTSFWEGGKEYTPRSYMSSLGLDLNNYVDVSSWSHHPFYETITIEVPDNWRGQPAYNVPLDDMMSIIDNAIENGYTIAWAGDVTETGFTKEGIAIVPDVKRQTKSNHEQHINALPSYLQIPYSEMNITQKLRQEGFDNYSTTYDYAMHIYGKAKDQNGNVYYMAKNSWGETGAYNGIWYLSEAYVRYKTVDLVVNKNAIPSEIRNKLGL